MKRNYSYTNKAGVVATKLLGGPLTKQEWSDVRDSVRTTSGWRDVRYTIDGRLVQIARKGTRNFKYRFVGVLETASRKIDRALATQGIDAAMKVYKEFMSRFT